MTDSQQLLAEYAKSDSESAFRELVTRYFGLVYSTALRLVGGDTHLAEDVAQTVFSDLARKAHGLPGGATLGGWLHQRTYNVAAPMMRAQRRRQSREREAVQMNALQADPGANLAQVAPFLDEAIMRLGTEDRTAIMLCFFERRDFRSIGQALGSSEDAARMRVTRALEKLHTLLTHRGVTLSAAALGTALATEAVTAAPAGLAASVAATVLVSTGESGGVTAPLGKLMATMKLKAGLISAIVVASVVAPLLLQHKAQGRLHNHDEALRQQADQLAELQAENERLSKPLAGSNSSPALSTAQVSELLKLRGEVGLLRQRAQELTKVAAIREEEAPLSRDQLWPARVNRLKHWLEEHPGEKIPELQLLSDRQWMDALYSSTPETPDEYRVSMSDVRSVAELTFATFTLRSALQRYAKDDSGQFPTDLSQLRPYFDSPIYDSILERYTILPASTLVSELRPGGDWVITQKAPVNEAQDWRTATSLTGTAQATPHVTNRWLLLQ